MRKMRKLVGVLSVAASVAAFVPAGTEAQNAPLVVSTDRGGVIGERVTAIDRIRALRQRVEIRGPLCLSSCTMLLGAGDVCVDPDAKLGFHGPSLYGRPLTEDQFDYWSEIMATYYPEPLRRWFMKEARFRIAGYYTVTGENVIELGVKRC
ncbi:hypothetical protein [Tranquillimonas alkanivorans]|uniref:Uncharacterized protein n=1 Tax=Tranquillimonas alkanivorans TaxID=441119 RepID=A0A1I5Q854_9RHOB|nr:hypothetical protein [Tranquillimonas alkanivorans]SFP42191.1 hypothetical protein SAMN04488047_106102 [Tranquillimonas alkanivorans]